MRQIMNMFVLLSMVAGCKALPNRHAEHTATKSKFRLTSNPSSVAYTRDFTPPGKPGLKGPHPIEFYVAMALERNPELRAAQLSVRAQAEVIPQATALDDPMVNNNIWPFPERSPQIAMGRMPYGMMVSQSVPWFGKLRTRGEVAQQDGVIALARLAQTELKVVEDVRLAYFELYVNQRSIDITQENRRLLEDLLQIADARYRTGNTSQQDVLRAQVELDRIDERLVLLKQAFQEAQADLAGLLNINADSQPEALKELIASSVPEEIRRLYDLAVQCQPELEEQLAGVVKEQRSAELAELQYYPDFTFGFGWDVMTTNRALATTADGMDNFGFTVGFNIPLWRGKLRAGVSEARLRAAANAGRYDASRSNTFRQIRRLMVQARALDEQIQLYSESIIPRADQTLQVSIADYRVGRIDFLPLFDNWMQLLMFQLQLVQLEAGLEQTLASLERAVGCAVVEPVPPMVTSDTVSIEDEAERGQQTLPSPEIAPEQDELIDGFNASNSSSRGVGLAR